jgi:hypothetical protein
MSETLPIPARVPVPPPARSVETAVVRIRAGTLRVEVESARWPLAELCGYASRRSRKRGFVFVSKVLGKHRAARPETIRRTYVDLASMLPAADGPAVVIGMAETATALGQGVAEEWRARTGRDDVLFLHTTRYRLGRPPALTFDEPHSHATEHLVYEPADAAARTIFDAARMLVLVDDELSTGRTLVNLATAYVRHHPGVESVWVVCLTDWLGPARRAELSREVGRPVGVVSLLAGRFAFTPNPDFDPGQVPDVTGRGDAKDTLLPARSGRTGLIGRDLAGAAARAAALNVRPGQRVLVLGTGEFAYRPFRLAEELAAAGHDVWFQTTTRSPLVRDGEIGSVLEFEDNYHDGMPNYLYNAAGRTYDRVLIGYETRSLPPGHRLPAMLRGEAVFL